MSTKMNAMEETVGEMVRRLRIANRWSMEKLAEKSGLAKGTISKIESDQIAGGRLKTIAALAEALSLPLDAFAGDFRRRAQRMSAEPPAFYSDSAARARTRAELQADRIVWLAKSNNLTEADLDLIDALLNYFGNRG